VGCVKNDIKSFEAVPTGHTSSIDGEENQLANRIFTGKRSSQ